MAKRKAEFRIHTEVQLPSGNVVLLKPVSMFDLVKKGSVPQTLLPLIEDATNRKVGERMNLEQMTDLVELVDFVAMKCFVDPPLAEAETEEALSVYDIPFNDKLSVFNWANQGPQALKPFRGEPAREP